MKHREIVNALTYLLPDAKWSLYGDNYENIVWLDEDEILPSEAELIQANLDYQKMIVSETETKEAARAELLARLGITADEAKLLLGGI